MKKFILGGITFVACAGCSNLSSFKPASLSVPSPQITGAETRPSLADPRDQELQIALETATLAEQRGMDVEAIDAYLEVRRLDPSRRGIAHSLAVLYDRSGMTDAASREYEAALRESPGSADLHCDYGYFLYWTGQAERAETSLREALRLDPKHTQAKVNLALVAGDRGRFDEAQELFTQAIGPAAALHNVGMLRLRAGDVEGGKAMLAEAKRRDPSISVGSPVLARLAANTPQPAETSASPIGTGVSSKHIEKR